MIRFEGVRFDYGVDGPALQETDLDIGAGLTLLLGPNGAGKTTLLKLAAGVERPRTGRVSVDGRDLWSDEAAARLRLAYVPEQPDLTPYATLRELMRLVCLLRGEPTQHGTEALARAGLEAVADRTVRELSLGQRRRALLAAAFIGHPPTLLLDEPLEGMDRAMRRFLVTWVERETSGGATVLVATHEIEPFAALASRAVALADGHATLWEQLSSVSAERLRQLEALARGER